MSASKSSISWTFGFSVVINSLYPHCVSTFVLVKFPFLTPSAWRIAVISRWSKSGAASHSAEAPRRNCGRSRLNLLINDPKRTYPSLIHLYPSYIRRPLTTARGSASEKRGKVKQAGTSKLAVGSAEGQAKSRFGATRFGASF